MHTLPDFNEHSLKDIELNLLVVKSVLCQVVVLPSYQMHEACTVMHILILLMPINAPVIIL